MSRTKAMEGPEPVANAEPRSLAYGSLNRCTYPLVEQLIGHIAGGRDVRRWARDTRSRDRRSGAVKRPLTCVTRNPGEQLQGAATGRSTGPVNSAPRSGCKTWRLAAAQYHTMSTPIPSRLCHRLGPSDMPLEAKRSRHVAVAIPIVAVGGLVGVGAG